MEAKFLTDRGQVRSHNEDAGGIYYNQSGQLLAVIADGMGGHQAGDIASQLAVSFVKDKWENSEKIQSPEQSKEWLIRTVDEINGLIYDRSLENKNLNSMGTTIVTAIVTEDYVTVAHVGDSRCYIYNNHGLSQVTEDHSLVNELIRSGEISESEALNHPRKNIVLKALGTEEPENADVKTISWEPSNKLLLCSDGLTDKVGADDLERLLKQPETLEKTGEQMIKLANERGGEDNISLVIIAYPFNDERGETTC